MPAMKTVTAPIVLWTGARRWEGPPTILPSTKGRVEHGPGIYFTTRLDTARKYARGGGVVMRFEIDPDFIWLEQAIVPTDALIAWVKSRPGLRKKKEIITDLRSNAARTSQRLGEGMSHAEALLNLLVNYEAVTGAHGPALAEFFAGMGIGASHAKSSFDEDWVVLFDPSKIVAFRRMSPTDSTVDLPRVARAGLATRVPRV